MRTYQLIFEGRIQEGHDPETVRQNLASLFGVAVAEIESLFDGPAVVLKDGLDAETARRDQAAFESTGAICRLVVQTPSGGHPGDKTQTATEPADATAGDADNDRQTFVHPPGVRRYDLRHPYLLAFFFKPFYRDVARHWHGLVFVHLLILLALTGVGFVRHFQTVATAFIADQVPAILAQIPPIEIDRGNVKVAVEQPYQIHRADGHLFAVIDTTGQITTLRQTDAMLLLTRSGLMERFGSGDSRVIDLSPIEKLHLTRNDIDQWLQTSLRWAPLILYPLMLFFSYCLRTVQVLIYVGISKNWSWDKLPDPSTNCKEMPKCRLFILNSSSFLH